MKSPSLAVFVAVALAVLLAAPAVLGRPPHRQKRVSDQRLSELEALIALKKLRGKLVTVPVAFGQINPNDYGRKRRSAPTSNSVRDAVLLERILESLPPEDAVLALDLSLDDEGLPGLPGPAEAQAQHWAYERERPASAFNRPVTE